MAAHPVDVHVGKRLRLKRTILGLSQEVIGEAIGVTSQQVQKYERGVNRLSASRMYDFAKQLGVEISYFFDEYDGDAGDITGTLHGMAEGKSEGFEYEKMSSREAMEMMRSYYRIRNAQTRKKIADLIRSLADEDE